MDLRRATLMSLVLYTLFILLEAYMFVGGLIGYETAMTLLGIGCILVCVPLLLQLTRERRAESPTNRPRLK